MIRTVIESAFGRNVDGSKCTPAAVVTAERDYLLTGVSASEARVMRSELAKERG